MDTATLLELRALRARAYGPSADIDQDPAAVQRLRELEALHAEPAHATPDDEPAVEPRAPTAPEWQPDVEAEGRSEPPPAEVGVASRRARADRRRSARALPRRIRLLWVLSVVASGAVAAGITYAMVSVSPVSADSGAQQIATLTPSTVVEIPAGWFGAGPSSVAYEYFGLTLFETGGGYGVAGSECFAAVATEQLPKPDVDVNSWSVNGPVLTGCRVGSFPATVQMVVDSSAPEEMRSRFPSRSALQFVLDDERIGVFLAGE